jgi:DNA repair exonuclease SbcCD ATPase subunit
MKAQEKRAKLYAMAEAAMPQPIFPEGNRERDGGDDWGSERQIEASNAFFEFAESIGADLDDLQTAKATIDDMINEACRRAEANLIVEELQEEDAASFERFKQRWDAWQKWQQWQPKPNLVEAAFVMASGEIVDALVEFRPIKGGAS